jgi:hypothetical protein
MLGTPYQWSSIIAVVSQCMAKLVRKLKTILRPVSVLRRQTDCNPTARHGFKIGLWMIGSVIHIDCGELSMWAIPPKFTRC